MRDGQVQLPGCWQGWSCGHSDWSPCPHPGHMWCFPREQPGRPCPHPSWLRALSLPIAAQTLSSPITAQNPVLTHRGSKPCLYPSRLRALSSPIAAQNPVFTHCGSEPCPHPLQLKGLKRALGHPRWRLEEAMAPTPVLSPGKPYDGGAWWAAVHGVVKSWARLSDFTFTFHFHALEKEMATHSSVLAWRIPGTGEPGGCRLWSRTESDTTEVT